MADAQDGAGCNAGSGSSRAIGGAGLGASTALEIRGPLVQVTGKGA